MCIPRSLWSQAVSFHHISTFSLVIDFLSPDKDLIWSDQSYSEFPKCNLVINRDLRLPSRKAARRTTRLLWRKTTNTARFKQQVQTFLFILCTDCTRFSFVCFPEWKSNLTHFESLDALIVRPMSTTIGSKFSAIKISYLVNLKAFVIKRYFALRYHNFVA